MKKLNLIKKMMLIASTAFMATSLVFVPSGQNKEVNLNQSKQFKSEIVRMKNEKRNVRYICKVMEQNETWLEVVDVKRISGSVLDNKFTEIDFSDLTVEGDPSIPYQLKSINIPLEKIDSIYDKRNFSYVNMGHWKWINIQQNFLNNITLSSENILINIGKELFDPELVRNGFLFTVGTSYFKQLILNFEENTSENVMGGIHIFESTFNKIIFKGAKMSLDYHENTKTQKLGLKNIFTREIIFENEISGVNLEYFFRISSLISEERAKMIFKNKTNQMNIFSVSYDKKHERNYYNMESNLDIHVLDFDAKINLLQHNFPEGNSDWFWSLNDVNGENKTTLHISTKAYQLIQEDPQKKERWDRAEEAARERIYHNNRIPWHKRLSYPARIKSSLVNKHINRVNVGETVDFNLELSPGPGDYFNNDFLKLFEKHPGDIDVIVPREQYSLIVNDVEGIPNEKVAKVTFLLPYNYKKLIFGYQYGEFDGAKDISPGVDIEVSEPKVAITLSSEYDFSRKLAKGESITFKLGATKDVEWKNTATGVKLDLTDTEGHKVNVNDYFDFQWDNDKITNDKAEFKVTSKNKQFTEKALTLKVVKIDDPSIYTETKTIKLFDEQPLTLTLNTTADLSQPIAKNQSIEFTLTATKDFNWKDAVNGAQLVLTNNEGSSIEINSYFNFAWNEGSISSQTAKFILTSNKRNEVLTSVKLKVVKKNEQAISTETKTIKLFDQPEPKLRITLSSEYDFSRKLAKDESIVFKLDATKDVDWKNSSTGVVFDLTDAGGDKVNVNDYFDFKWDKEMNNTTAQFTLTSKNKQFTEKALTLKVVKIDDPSIETTTKTIKLFDEQPLTLTLNTTADLSQPIAKNQSIEFTLTATKDFNWKDAVNGAQLVLTNNEGSSIEINSYFNFAWNEGSISSQTAKFILTSNKRNEVLTSVKLKVVKKNEQTISTETKTIKLFDQPEPKVAITLSSEYDFSKKLAKDESIVFKLEATKDVDWKNTATGVKLDLTDERGDTVRLEDYFDFKWDKEMNNTTAQFILTSKNKQFTEKALTLKVVKRDDPSIETATKTIRLFDEVEPEPKVVLNLLTDFDLENSVKKDDVIEFTLNATKDFKWKDEASGVKFVLTNSEDTEINLEDYFTFAWDDSSISSQTAKFTLTSKVEHKKLTSVNLKVVKKDDQSISTETKTIKLFDEPNPDDKTSNSNNLIIIGASAGAGALVASTATGIIISKKRKRSKQL